MNENDDKRQILRELRQLRNTIANLALIIILCTMGILVAIINPELAGLLILLGVLLASYFFSRRHEKDSDDETIREREE